MKRRFNLYLSGFGILALALTGCQPKHDDVPPSPSVNVDAPTKTITLSSAFKKEASSNKYFSSELVRSVGGTQEFISANSKAVLESGKKANLFAYEAKAGSSFGVTVVDREGKDATSIVADDGTITAPSVTQKTIYEVYLFAGDSANRVKKPLTLTVIPDGSLAADEYYDFSSLGNAERTKMTAEAERYLLNNGLAPITFVDDGGYQLYSDRVHSEFLDDNNYITGYGFGIFDYGSITKEMEKEQTPAYKLFLHSQVDATSDTGSFNYLGSNSAAVSTFYEYISQYYFRTLVNEKGNGYEYTNGLSRLDAPIAVNPDENGASDTWKIMLRVGGSTANESLGVTPGFNFRTATTDSKLKAYDNRPIQLKDYLTPFKLLATASVGWFRGSEQAAETTVNRQIKGFAEYYQSSGGFTELESDEEFMKKVGVKIDPTDNSITITFNGKITPDYAEYQLNGLWCNPISEEFVKDLGGGDVIKGAKTYGNGSDGLTPKDTMLCVGPYYTMTYESKKTVAYAKNESWPLTKDNYGRDLYQIKGFHLNINSALATDPNTIIKMFEQGLTDSSNIPSDYWNKYATSPLRKKVPGSGYFPIYFINTFDKRSWEELFGKTGTDWEVKPILSNENFYKGLIVGIDRNTIADYYHSGAGFGIHEPTTRVSPKSSTAYNDSDEHKAVMEEVFGSTMDAENYSQWKNNAADYFEAAIQEELEAGHYSLGTSSSPTVVSMKLVSTDDPTRQYCDNVIFSGWESAFELAVQSHINDKGVNDWVDPTTKKSLITLDVSAENASMSLGDTQLQNMILYEGVKVGKYDGQTVFRVTGNGLDAFNNMNKYMSNDSSGFTLNFGVDTGIPTGDIAYDDKYWSFDALWGAANGGVLTDEIGAQANLFSFDSNGADISGDTKTKLTVTMPVDVNTKYVSNIKVYRDEIDLTTGVEEYKLTNAKVENGSVTIEFDGNSLIPGALLGEDYAAYTYIDFMFEYDVTINGEVTTQSTGGYFLVENTK